MVQCVVRDDTAKNPKVEFWLENDEDGVKLMARRMDMGVTAFPYSILLITENGLCRYTGISGLGLRMDERSAIALDTYL